MACISRIARACTTTTNRRSRRSSATRAGSPASLSAHGKRTVVHGDHYVAALPLERIAPLVNSAAVRRGPGARQPAAPGVQRGMDERGAVLSAPRRADGARARHSHRHRMGADQRLAAPVLAQRAARAVRRQRRARRHFGRCLRLDGAGRRRARRDALFARRGGARDMAAAQALDQCRAGAPAR